MWFWIAIAAALTALAHTAPFPFVLDALAPRHVMWRAPASRDAPTIYLTFDDGPNPSVTPQLLDVLARERVRATFFLVDRHVTAETAPIVRRMFADGHGVAVHSYTRGRMFDSPGELAAWIDGAADRIEHAGGARPCPAFRPHAGWRSATMIAGVARAGYQLVGWSWNAWDWNWFRKRTGESVARRIAARASDGLIVVIHDADEKDPDADRRYAVDAVAQLVPILKSRGFAFGTICDAIDRERR